MIYSISTTDLQWLCLTHWGWVTHICVSKLAFIGSDIGLANRQAFIWTNAGILLIGPMETNVSEIELEIYIFPLKNALENVRKLAAIFSRPQCAKTRPIMACLCDVWGRLCDTSYMYVGLRSLPENLLHSCIWFYFILLWPSGIGIVYVATDIYIYK